MPTISLTTFVDFVAATGTARITKVRNAKKFYDQGYAPERDFYKPLRDRIEECLASGWDAAAFKKSLADITDPKKIENYEECRKGLSTWIGRKTIVRHPAVRGPWKSGNVEVTVNPELHIDIDGVPHLIKLYLKSDALSKQKANVALHLIGKRAPKNTTVGVLDVRRAKLFAPTVPIPGMDALLAAEAAALGTLWSSV